MDNRIKNIAFIPARGGSKGIPGKNIKLFAGKPLIVHTIHHAQTAILIDEVYVSTDDDTIAEISRSAGARIIERPPELAGDTATTESAISHGIEVLAEEGVTPDIIALLQVTSPLRPLSALQDAIEKFLLYRSDSLVSVSPTHRFFWKIQGHTAQPNYDFMNRPRRQDITSAERVYVENGSFYIFTRDHFEQTGNRLGGKIGYAILPEEYSYEIDSPADFRMLEHIHSQLSLD